MPIHASLNVPGAAASPALAATDARMQAEIAALAARHGMNLAANPEMMRWLVKADLPAALDQRGFAAISALVGHLYGLSTPGGNPRSAG